VAALRGAELWQLKLNAGGDTVTSATSFLTGVYGRIRDVLVHPDGRVFISTSNYDWAGTEGADDDRIIELEAESSTAINSSDATGLRVAPNPAVRMVRIERPTGRNGDPRLHIIDAAGRSVLRVDRLHGDMLIVEHLPDGCYHLMLNWPDGSGARTVLVVQH
ncbi:MAG: PQQ-dependent sugar dehydrogenase, partial [Flavobacteriales bacterium]|nr:PQQ-dependent sugar dehydrogenase [Flavobacteriales bacterium]